MSSVHLLLSLHAPRGQGCDPGSQTARNSSHTSPDVHGLDPSRQRQSTQASTPSQKRLFWQSASSQHSQTDVSHLCSGGSESLVGGGSMEGHPNSPGNPMPGRASRNRLNTRCWFLATIFRPREKKHACCPLVIAPNPIVKVFHLYWHVP